MGVISSSRNRCAVKDFVKLAILFVMDVSIVAGGVVGMCAPNAKWKINFLLSIKDIKFMWRIATRRRLFK